MGENVKNVFTLRRHQGEWVICREGGEKFPYFAIRDRAEAHYVCELATEAFRAGMKYQFEESNKQAQKLMEKFGI